MNKGMLFKLQIKRAFKIYPTIFLITIVTVLAIGTTLFFLIDSEKNDESHKKISVGIVGDIEDTHFGIGIHVLENMDSSRFFMNFPRMTEEEAIVALKNSEISGYVYIPEKFVSGIYYGDNIPAKYVVMDGPSGFGTALSGEVLNVLSRMVIETQTGCYSFRDATRPFLKRNVINKTVNNMNFSYIEFVLNRNKSYELEFVGVADQITLSGYFLCGIITFFLLIWGISCNKLLSRRNLALSRSLKSAGIKPGLQIAAEYTSYLIVTLITLVVFAIPIGIFASGENIGIRELQDVSVGSCMLFVIKIVPAVAMFTMMHKAMYEFFPGTVSGILVQFLISVGLGYISGCFYPAYFFPDSVQAFASVLPSGAGFSYIRKVLSATLSFTDIILPLVYTLFFAMLTLVMRKRAMGGEAE